MRLAELRPAALYVVDGQVSEQYLDTKLDDAQGIDFTCPRCGTHRVRVWFAERGVAPILRPARRVIVEDAISVGYVSLRGRVPTEPLACAWEGAIVKGEVTP